MDLNLERKVVLLTGANGGIGMAIAQGFLREGAIVICLVRGDRSRITELDEWVKAENISRDQLFCYDVDIGNKATLAEAVDVVAKEHKSIDILVNNAGSAIETPFLALTDDEWDQTIEINLNVTARLIHLVARHMYRQKSGSIVNISSVVSHATGRGVSAYAAAKAGVNRLTEILALEMGRKGIRVNAVAPGAIDTKMSRALMTRAGDIVLERTPLGRMGLPIEVANAVLFLSSEKTAAFITGHIFNVDGGICL